MKDYVIKATSGNGQVRAYVGRTKFLVIPTYADRKSVV